VSDLPGDDLVVGGVTLGVLTATSWPLLDKFGCSNPRLTGDRFGSTTGGRVGKIF